MSEIVYNGREELEVFNEAKNYNNFVLGLITSCAKPGATVVDFGAGLGVFSVPLSKKYDILCVETDPSMKEVLAGHGLKVTDDLETVPDGSIDCIFSCHVLEHIEDDVATIKMWHRKLKQGGRLFVYLPAFMCLYGSMDKKIGHFRRYHRKDLKEKLTAGGFAVTDVRYSESAGFAASVYNKHFGHQDGSLNPTMLKIYDRVLFPLGRIFDVLTFGRLFGKNVYAFAEKK